MPACDVELDAGVTPLDSIVVCARCCAALYWDGRFSIATTYQIGNLSSRDRAKLDAIVVAQIERNQNRTSN